jgi:hypothetical protein
MIALLLLLGLLIYIGLAVLFTLFIRRGLTTSRAKSIATVVPLLAFILIPTADEFAGKWYFEHLCETEAKSVINKSVDGVEGIFNPGMPFSELEKLGYKYREYELSGKYYRSSRDSNGKEVDREIPRLTARYVVKGKTWDEIRLNVRKWEELIVDIQTSEALAHYTTFSYGGGWVSRVLKNFGLSGGAMCQPPMAGYKEFYVNTLRPAKS